MDRIMLVLHVGVAAHGEEPYNGSAQYFAGRPSGSAVLFRCACDGQQSITACRRSSAAPRSSEPDSHHPQWLDIACSGLWMSERLW